MPEGIGQDQKWLNITKFYVNAHKNSVKWPRFPWFLVAQFIEHPQSVWEVMVSIPVRTQIFVVQRSCHVDHFSLPSLKIYCLYLNIKFSWCSRELWTDNQMSNTFMPRKHSSKNVFFPQEAIPSKLICEKIHAPYWSITYNTIQCMSNLL